MKLIPKIVLSLLLALSLFSLSACGQTAPETAALPEADAASEAGAATPQSARDYGTVGTFITKDTEGNEVTEAVFSQADVTMLNVWATFCGYCIEEMPDLTALNEEFADQGVQILGLVGDVGDGKGGFTEEDMAEAQTIMDQAGAKFPTLMPSLELIRHLMPEVPGYPTTFFVDSNGNLLGEPVVGARGEAAWRDAIEAYLKIAPGREAAK